MNIAEDTAALHTRHTGLLCVLATPTDTELATAAADTLRLDLPGPPRGPRRPRARVSTGQVELLLFALGEDRQLLPVQITVARDGLLVVAAEPVLASLRTPIHDHHGDVYSGLVAALLALAQHTQHALDELADDTQQLATRAHGYTSAPQRRAMGRMRAQLFELGEVETTQHRLLGPDEELAQSLDNDDQRRLLKRAAAAFDDTRSLATQLYARLGDILDQQATIVSERLTLVATIFLPLTLVTGFFGMNLNWMLNRLDGLPAFLGFGIVVPVLLTVVTLVLIRHLTRSS